MLSLFETLSNVRGSRVGMGKIARNTIYMALKKRSILRRDYGSTQETGAALTKIDQIVVNKRNKDREV
jgi:hypothetical protein